ncbi:MAG TPA: ATP-binding protein [Gammaproteobacteria bacterium]|nr:ATP-binding protein [Gammaproteobacteria bacterium]
MTASKPAAELPLSLEAVLRTEELMRRPARSPDHRAENRALLVLAEDLSRAPGSVLQRLADVALDLCRAHSAGISLLEEADPGAGGDRIRWHAVAGRWKPLLWTAIPRDAGPCGTVIDRDSVLLFSNAHLHYTQFADVDPPCVEALLLPFHVAGQAVGTVWVVAHDDSHKFDAEDRRLLQSLATFAAMAYQAQAMLAAQARANEELQAENRERRRAERALREADRRKSEFLAMLAHELRNPLAPIRNGMEILRRLRGEDRQVKPVTDMMQRQIAHMERLVDDLLDVSRISRGTIELRRETIELAAVIHRAVEAVQPLCERIAHELTVTLPPQPIHLHADPVRLAQVVGNLLNNACKFSEKGGRIRLSAERDGKQVLIRVQDSGIGIAGPQLARIFEMFTQIETSLERSRDGLGLGLTLVKRLVELHDGTVEARSAGLGRGSEFLVRLPMLAGALSPPLNDSSREGLAAARRRILVVDDNRDAADSLALLLNLSGHDVHTAHDGLEAVASAAKLPFDVILLDLGLPGLDGCEAARRIREQQGEKRPMLVAVTGWGQADDRRRTNDAGFDAHLVKPVDFAVLTKLLSALEAD